MQSLDVKEEWDEEFISETSGMALSPDVDHVAIVWVVLLFKF